MGIVTLPSFGSDPATITAPGLDGKVDPLATEFNGNIENVNIAAGAAIAESKLNLSSITQAVTMSSKQFLWAKGADVASATSIALGTDGNYFDITGTTDIETITAKQAGSVVLLQFDGALNLVDDTGNLELNGSDLSVNAEDHVILVSDGTNWHLATSSKRPDSLSENYRDQFTIRQATSTTITVNQGILEVNTNKIEKTAATTLTLTTAGDWAGGSSLQATSTYGYIGVDSSGNIKMHTTAPSHDDYSLSSTSGKKRYVSWSSTTYRVIGWFYMNATGAGELNAYEVGNISEHGIGNVSFNSTTTDETISSSQTTYQTIDGSTINYYSSGGKVTVTLQALCHAAAGNVFQARCSYAGATQDTSVCGNRTNGSTDDEGSSVLGQHVDSGAQGTKAVLWQSKLSSAANYTITSMNVRIEEVDA